MRIYILTLIIIIIICIIYYNINQKVNKEIFIDRSKQTLIQKKIWTYWHDDLLPEIIQKCIKTWRLHNPDYDIQILNNLNYKKYIKGCDILSYPASRFHQRVSDFMRIHVLNQQGGIWLDASIILNESLDWVLKKYNEGKYEFIGYHIASKETKPEYPVIENWFMAAPLGSGFIRKWLEKFLESNNYDSDYDYLLSLETNKVDLQLISKSGYLSMHYAAQYVLQKEMSIEDIKTRLYLEKAEDGPFKYLHDNKWDLKKSLLALCDNKDLRTKVVKFRNAERKVIEDEKIFCIFNDIKK